MNEKHAIGLYGRANVGKTTTLKLLFDLLSRTYPTASVQNFHFSENDITVIIDIKGLLLGIGSEGDPNGSLDRTIKLFVEKSCTIIVCATRTRGGTVKLVERLQPEFTVEWYEKKSATLAQRDHGNMLMAETLLARVQTLLSA